MYFKNNFFFLSALTLSTFGSQAFAVIADHPLPTRGSAPQVCYIKFWGEDADIMHPHAGCTGSLIRQNRLLTAAHCMDNLAAGYSASISCNNGNQGYDVMGYDQHPLYLHRVDAQGHTIADDHDVALFDLKLPRHPIAPVAMVSTYDEENALLAQPQNCTLYGYGRSDEAISNSNWGYLILAVIDYLTPDAWKTISTWTANPQDVYLGPTVRAAPGDSGGPILCKKPDGSLIQIASTVEAGQLTDVNNPHKGFKYSRHEAIPYNYDWINQAADLPVLAHKL